MGADATVAINGSPRTVLNVGPPLALNIEYVDEMGYMYVSCQGCPNFTTRCDACVALTWEVSHEYWAMEDAQAALEAVDLRPSVVECWDVD